MKKRKNIIEQQGPFSVSDFNPDFDQIGNLSQELIRNMISSITPNFSLASDPILRQDPGYLLSHVVVEVAKDLATPETVKRLKALWPQLKETANKRLNKIVSKTTKISPQAFGFRFEASVYNTSFVDDRFDPDGRAGQGAVWSPGMSADTQEISEPLPSPSELGIEDTIDNPNSGFILITLSAQPHGAKSDFEASGPGEDSYTPSNLHEIFRKTKKPKNNKLILEAHREGRKTHPVARNNWWYDA